jgi:hypothetical protein
MLDDLEDDGTEQGNESLPWSRWWFLV